MADIKDFICENIVLHYLVGPSLGPCGPELGGGVLLAEVLELRVTRYVDTGDQVKLEHNTEWNNVFFKHFMTLLLGVAFSM
jgi:hypothetical protein